MKKPYKKFNMVNVYYLQVQDFLLVQCYTLNYDEILERAYLENNKLLSSVTLSDESEQYRTSSVCVHLNGVISQLSRATIDNSFKLT